MALRYQDGDREQKARVERLQGGQALRTPGVERVNVNQTNLRRDGQGHQLPESVRRTREAPPGGRPPVR